MIEKLCPVSTAIVSSSHSIAERRSAKLATKGRNVNLSPQKIQLPIKDDISEGNDNDDDESDGEERVDFVPVTGSAVFAQHYLPRLNSCQITKTGFFLNAGANMNANGNMINSSGATRKFSETHSTAIASPPKPVSLPAQSSAVEAA